MFEHTTFDEDMLNDIEDESIYMKERDSEEMEEYNETGRLPSKWGNKEDDDISDG